MEFDRTKVVLKPQNPLPPIFHHNFPADAKELPEDVEPEEIPYKPTYREKWGISDEDKSLFNLRDRWATATSADGLVFVWPLDHPSPTPPCVRAVHANGDVISDYVIDFERMVSASVGLDCTLALWSIEDEKMLTKIKNDTGMSIYDCFLSVDCDNTVGKAAVGDARGKIKIADVEYGKWLFKLTGHSGFKKDVYGVRADWDQNLVVSASWDHTVRVWDIRSGKEVRCLEGHQGFPNRVDVNFEMMLAMTCAYEHALYLWDIKSGQLIQSWESHRANDLCVDWNNSVCVTGGDDEAIRVWDMETTECTMRIDSEHLSIQAIDVDWDRGIVLAGHLDKKLQLFDLRTGEVLKTFNKNRRIITQCWLQKGD